MAMVGHQDTPLAPIGIVAIGRNEGARLERCLTSLLERSRQVVYADSASSDGSVAVARRLGIEVVVLRHDALLSAAAGRAAGFERLQILNPKVELVQFIDGDCLLDADWLATAEHFLRSRPHVAVVCGRRYEAQPGASVYNAMCDAEWDTPIGAAESCGGDALYRVEAYKAARGFRTNLLAGEEPELCARLRLLGWQVWRIDAAMTEHDARMLTFAQWWRRSRRGGYGYAQVWDTTRTTAFALYGRQLASAAIWAIAFPMTMIVFAIVMRQPLVLAAIPFAYAVQTIRIFRKIRSDRSQRLVQAALILLAKIPESLGALRYLVRANRPAAGTEP